MQVTLLGSSEAWEELNRALGGTLDEKVVAADLIRHEASARGSCPRHFLVDRVRRLAAPAVALDLEMISDVCEELERQGDVILAEGGWVYPSPVRIVALGEGLFRFICALPSSRLAAAVAGEWMRLNTRRECRVLRPIEEVANALGGVVMDPESWAGLDRAPHADGAWLRSLDARLAWHPEPAGSLEHEEPLVWSGFFTDASEPRWRSTGPARLWRSRHRWKRWVHAWTAGGPPSQQPFVSLSPDEGARAVFAEARAMGAPLRGSLRERSGEVTISISGWLPQAEYRFLSTCAEVVEATGRGSTWTTPTTRAAAVVNTLTERLGLRMEQVQAR